MEISILEKCRLMNVNEFVSYFQSNGFHIYNSNEDDFLKFIMNRDDVNPQFREREKELASFLNSNNAVKLTKNKDEVLLLNGGSVDASVSFISDCPEFKMNLKPFLAEYTFLCSKQELYNKSSGLSKNTQLFRNDSNGIIYIEYDTGYFSLNLLSPESLEFISTVNQYSQKPALEELSINLNIDELEKCRLMTFPNFKHYFISKGFYIEGEFDDGIALIKDKHKVYQQVIKGGKVFTLKTASQSYSNDLKTQLKEYVYLGSKSYVDGKGVGYLMEVYKKGNEGLIVYSDYKNVEFSFTLITDEGFIDAFNEVSSTTNESYKGNSGCMLLLIFLVIPSVLIAVTCF